MRQTDSLRMAFLSSPFFLFLSFFPIYTSVFLFFFKWVDDCLRSMNVQFYIDHTQDNIPGEVRKKKLSISGGNRFYSESNERGVDQ